MEECFLCLGSRHPLLHVIHYQHIDSLIEMDEIVDAVLHLCTGVLHLKQSGADIQHAFLRVQLLGAYTDRIDQVCLSASTGTVDKHRIELRSSRVLRNRKSYTAWQLVTVALNEVCEGVVGIQLTVDVLWLGCIQFCG